MSAFWLGFVTGILGLLASSAVTAAVVTAALRAGKRIDPEPVAQNDIHLTKINSTYVREFHHD